MTVQELAQPRSINVLTLDRKDEKRKSSFDSPETTQYIKGRAGTQTQAFAYACPSALCHPGFAGRSGTRGSNPTQHQEA